MRLALLCSLALAFPALAQRAAPASPPRVQELVIDEAEEIDGVKVGPDSEVFTAPSNARHGSLIRVRADFRGKALASVAELR